ncbi:MAG: NUDIX hydrolase [Eubacterium sp.]|jgi:coenzyme A diphosphatase NUDT7
MASSDKSFGGTALADIKRIYSDHVPEPIGRHRFYSVLVPFVEKDGKLCLLFEKRAKDMLSQPSEICFPGGHFEKGETALDCALRETMEEIGLGRGDISVIGDGNALCGFADYTLYSIIASIYPAALDRIVLQKDEVDSVFTVPFDFFVENRPEDHFHPVTSDMRGFPYDKVGIGEDYAWRTAKHNVPIYPEYEGNVIWGITASIVEDIVKNVYKER